MFIIGNYQVCKMERKVTVWSAWSLPLALVAVSAGAQTHAGWWGDGQVLRGVRTGSPAVCPDLEVIVSASLARHPDSRGGSWLEC